MVSTPGTIMQVFWRKSQREVRSETSETQIFAWTHDYESARMHGQLLKTSAAMIPYGKQWITDAEVDLKKYWTTGPALAALKLNLLLHPTGLFH